ncbi:MAG: hypothetical protein KDK89_04790, partial [Alphaproteobacteria bacterium]|nr:hypothetical protein [Alphaproteobacteria bacterium]
MVNKDEIKESGTSWLLLIAVAGVIMLWLLMPFVLPFLVQCAASYFGSSVNYEASGQLGDAFGSINALFSGLAFAGLLYTIHLQRLELALQRRELEDTRKVLGSGLID